MYRKRIKAIYARLIPLTLFILGCFPSRGLYFLLHHSSTASHHRTYQPALDRPSDSTAKLTAPLARLPPRLSRVPRSLKESPDLSPERLASTTIPSRPNYRYFLAATSFVDEFRPGSRVTPQVDRAPPAAL